MEDLGVLEQMVHDLQVVIEESERLESFVDELFILIDKEIKHRRKMITDIAMAHVH